jgi:hypothetical protein
MNVQASYLLRFPLSATIMATAAGGDLDEALAQLRSWIDLINCSPPPERNDLPVRRAVYWMIGIFNFAEATEWLDAGFAHEHEAYSWRDAATAARWRSAKPDLDARDARSLHLGAYSETSGLSPEQFLRRFPPNAWRPPKTRAERPGPFEIVSA